MIRYDLQRGYFGYQEGQGLLRINASPVRQADLLAFGHSIAVDDLRDVGVLVDHKGVRSSFDIGMLLFFTRSSV